MHMDLLILIAASVGVLLVAVLLVGHARRAETPSDVDDEVHDWKIDARSRW